MKSDAGVVGVGRNALLADDIESSKDRVGSLEEIIGGREPFSIPEPAISATAKNFHGR